jgi:hypothetical protein
MKNPRLRDLVGEDTDSAALQRLRDSLPFDKARILDEILMILSSSDGPLSNREAKALSVKLEPIVRTLGAASASNDFGRFLDGYETLR